MVFKSHPLPHPHHPIRSLKFNFISLANELVVKNHLLVMRDYKNQGKLISFDLVSKFYNHRKWLALKRNVKENWHTTKVQSMKKR